jgi:hypothetical protein
MENPLLLSFTAYSKTLALMTLTTTTMRQRRLRDLAEQREYFELREVSFVQNAHRSFNTSSFLVFYETLY